MRRRPVAWSVALLLLAAVAGRAQEPLVRVSVRSEVPLEVAEIEPLLALRPGEPADEERIRRTVRNLRLAGLAAEIEVLVESSDAGLQAIVVLRPDVRVDEVTVSGETGIDAEKLAAELEQRAGHPLREDRVLRGLYAVQDRLTDEGFRGARVQLAVDVDEATRRARVDYRVTAGPRSRVGEVHLEGLPEEVAEAEALAALRARPGQPLRRVDVRDDAERLARFLISRSFRLAEVEAAIESPGAAAETVALAWRIQAGPRVELEVVGAERKLLEKRGLLPFLGDAGYDEALLVQSVGLIRAFYQARGHHGVEVRSSEERSPDRLRLRLEVDPGPRATLVELAFEGNEAFSDERLARLMLTAPRRLLSPGSGRLVDDVLSEDLSNLRSFYALAGFDHVRVGPARVEVRGEEELGLVVPIAEGQRRMVAEVTLAGVAALDAEKLRDELPLRAGGPYHRLLLESSVERIRSRLEEAGYRAAIVVPEVVWSSGSTVATVSFRVLEGDRSTAEAILVRGNRRTPTPIVRRFLGIAPGDPISNTRVLDVQRRLYRLGVFSRVQVDLPVTGSGAVASEVLIELEEGRTRTISYGAGYDSESGLRGLLRITEANLGGRLINVQFDALVSESDEVYRLLARQPYLGPWQVEVRALAYQEAEDRPQFQVDRRGLQLGLERGFGDLRAGLFWDYRIVETVYGADGEGGEITDEVIPLESREARVASLTPTLFWDHRDDPIAPTRGWSLAAQFERAFPAFAADAEFDRFFAQATWIVPLRRAGQVALSLRGGAIDPRAAPRDPTLDTFDAVPAAERFYAGGRTSHRAFPRDELGIAGETLRVVEGKDPVPLGGGLLALANLEWRFPLAGAFGGVVFLDGGNLWREAADFDPGEARWGAGTGLRYLSPIGPLRLEIGWNLDPEPWEEDYVWFFSLGNAF